MKILRLNLIAFGPFTEKVIAFNSNYPGLHIIYGHNEAGKSSALRALQCMLYGFPERISDDFIHPYAKLRIGGTLCLSNGKILEFIRRKARVNALRGADDAEVIDESELLLFLGGVDKSFFETMFGIDHARLVAGGQEIISGGGNIGQILFAGGSGISDFRKIQNELQNEAEALFTPSSRTRRINAGISSFKDKQKAIREAQLPGEAWEQHDAALSEAIRKKRAVEAELGQLQREHSRLERIRDAFPAIGRRKELLTDLEQYADAVLLSDDFGERRRELLTNLRIAENDESQAVRKLEQIRQTLTEADMPLILLEKADIIEDIYKKFGAYQKAAEDRRRIEGLLSSEKAEAKAVLHRLPKSLFRGFPGDFTLEQAEQLRLESAEIVRIQELSSEYDKLKTIKESTQEEIAKRSLRIERVKAQIEEIESHRDTEELRKVMEDARQHGDLEAHYEAECLEIRKAEAAAQIALKKLTLWTGSLETLEKSAVPSAESLDRFESLMKKAENEAEKLRANIEDIEHALTEIDGQTERLRLEREVPTEADLHDARHKREENWQVIRKGVFPVSENLADDYEKKVQHADSLADRLRREADRVAKKAALLANSETHKHRCVRFKEKLGKQETEIAGLADQWNTLWEPVGISPKSPGEMRGWLQRQGSLASQSAVIRERIVRAEQLKNRIEMHRREISRCLCETENISSDDDSLSQLLEKSRRVIARMDQIRVRRDKLSGESEQSEAELREAQARAEKTAQGLAEWRTRWTKAILPLGLEAEASPREANAVADDLKHLAVKLKEAGNHRKRMSGIDRDAKEFTQRVKALTEHAAPELLERPLEQVVSELNARLTRAREARARRQSSQKQEQHEEKQLQDARKRIADIHAGLAAICEEAGCRDYEGLARAEEASSHLKRIRAELEQTERQLRKFAGSATLDEFIQDAQNVDPDDIEQRLKRLAERIAELNQEKSESDQIIGSERTELKKMDGSARAAQLAEEAQGILARLQSDAEQYVRLRLAATVLTQAVEKYREKHQGPILKRSGEIFAHITLGSFEGLRLDPNEKGDGMVLKGIRPGGKNLVDVSGMSDGTADQLYLAVRLASLETHVKKNEPMPFILDDILIKFDDERSVATLEILAQLSEKTQVVFFTHHRHLLELATAHLNKELLFTHSL
ncbi:MAG: hypothetical protein BWK80_02705 [Desulfobacteraceae bacterium IS3]|nr:MAG: hypothetical protein BWK80_02705 [Desulfobacteraceae bacterium IS3]